MNYDLLTHAGAAIKALDRQVIGGHAVLFTNPWSTDRVNDFFTKDSDYDLVDRLTIRSLWHHGLDKTVTEPLGRATYTVQDEGIFARLKLKNDEVGNRIFNLAERGELAWSSGSSSHQVRKEQVGGANWIAVWPISEISVLPAAAAAEPRARVMALKSLADASVRPLLNSYEQRAAQIYAETIMVDHNLRMKGYIPSQHDDDRAGMQSYYNALAAREIRRHEAQMQRFRNG